MWTFGRKLSMGFALSFALLLLIGTLAYRGVDLLTQTSYQVTRTHAALTHVESLMSLMKDAETSQRGYLLAHALMFTGAICFRSHALVKTALSLLGIWLSLAAVFYLALRVFYFDAFDWDRLEAVRELHLYLAPAFAAEWMNWTLGAIFGLWILYAAYRCLRAHEVQNEL